MAYKIIFHLPIQFITAFAVKVILLPVCVIKILSLNEKDKTLRLNNIHFF